MAAAEGRLAEGRLAEGWRKVDRAKLLMQGRNFKGETIFASLPKATLRRVAAKMELLTFEPRATIVRQGDIGDSMYIILDGRCSVTQEAQVVGSAGTLREGDMFGEISLLTEQPCAASISAAEGSTVHALRLAKADVKDTLDKAWGDDEELTRRRELLASVPLFQGLSNGELLQIATQLDAVSYKDGSVIVRQGEPGDCMYIVAEGEARVSIDTVGVVAQLQFKDYFGELAIVEPSANTRAATVAAVGPTELLRLSQVAVHRALSSDKCAQVLELAKSKYLHSKRLRSSPLVLGAIEALWNLMVSASRQTAQAKAGAAGRWELMRQTAAEEDIVTREGYTEIHLRISKVLKAAFDLEAAKAIASKDWVEDITAISGDSSVNVWLEEVKKKLRAATTKTVATLGWKTLFDRFDTDGSGQLDAREFVDAVRREMQIPETTVSDDQLQALFGQVDADGGGDISATELAEWLASDDVRGDEDNDVKFTIQEASRAIVTKTGWDHLFRKYDTDGGGSLDFREFSLIIRNDCGLHAGILGPPELRELFNAVDVDRSAEIDAEEFSAFIKSDPLAMDMTFQVFAESCYQMAHLWVAEPDEDQYAKFLSAIFHGITNGDGSLRKIVGTKDGKGYKLGRLDDVKTIANEDGTLNIPGVKFRAQTGDRSQTGDSALGTNDGRHESEAEKSAKKKRKRKKKLRDSAKALTIMKGMQREASSEATLRVPHDDLDHQVGGYDGLYPQSSSLLGHRLVVDVFVAPMPKPTWPKELRGPDSDSDSDDGGEAEYGFGPGDGYGYGDQFGYGEGNRYSSGGYGCGGHGAGSRKKLMGLLPGGSYHTFPRHSVAGFRAVRCSLENSDEVEGKPRTNEVMRPSLMERAERHGIPIVGQRVGRRVHNLRSSPLARKREGAAGRTAHAVRHQTSHAHLNRSTPVADCTAGGVSRIDLPISSMTNLLHGSESKRSGTRERSAADDRPSSPTGLLSPTTLELGAWATLPCAGDREKPQEFLSPRLAEGNMGITTSGGDDGGGNALPSPTNACTPPRVLPPLEHSGQEASSIRLPVPLASELSIDDLIRNAPAIAAERRTKANLLIDLEPEPELQPEAQPEAVLEERLEAQPELHPEAQPELHPEAQPELHPEAQPQQPEPAPQSRLQDPQPDLLRTRSSSSPRPHALRASLPVVTSVPELQAKSEPEAQPQDVPNRGDVAHTSASSFEKQHTEDRVTTAAAAPIVQDNGSVDCFSDEAAKATKLTLEVDGMHELRAAQALFEKQQEARAEEYADARAAQTLQQALAQELHERKIANVMERGCVSYQQAEELLEETGGHAAYAIRQVDPLLPGDDPDGLHSLFDSIDTDGSGTLERDEIASLAQEMDTPLTERELDVAMLAMDADGSGEVDFDEFSEWYASMRKKGRMPSWGRAISELQRRGGRGKKDKPIRSAASDAAADQRAAMAMRSR